MLTRYISYLKDNPQRFWFKRKLYGYGWVPATWEGWFTLLVFITLLIISTLDLNTDIEPTSDQLLWFFIKVVFLVGAIILVSIIKGEKPRWQWGYPKKDS